MATIFKKKGTWFLDYYLNNRRVRKSLKTSSKKMAELALHDLEIKLAKNDLGLEVQDIPLEAFVEKYLANKATRVSPKTLIRNKVSLKNHILPFLAQNGVTRLKQISPLLIEEYVSMRAQKAKQATVNHELITFKNMFKMAIRWGYLHKDPAKEIKQFRISDQKAPRFLTMEETERLLENCTGTLYKMIYTILSTGLRKEELLNLEWRDLEFKRQTLTVAHEPPERTVKGKESRHIPLNPKLSEMLQQHRRDAAIADPKALVFTTRHGKKVDSLYHVLKGIYKNAEIEGANIHTLRHTFASHLVMQGVDLYTVSKLLGHKDIKTTQIYAHLAPDHLKAAIIRLPDFGHPNDTCKETAQNSLANSSI